MITGIRKDQPSFWLVFGLPGPSSFFVIILLAIVTVISVVPLVIAVAGSGEREVIVVVSISRIIRIFRFFPVIRFSSPCGASVTETTPDSFDRFSPCQWPPLYSGRFWRQVALLRRRDYPGSFLLEAVARDLYILPRFRAIL